MTTPTPGQGPAPLSANLRGAVDLSALARPRAQAPAAGGSEPAAATDGYIVEANQESFSALIQLSGQVPVIVELTAGWSDIATQLSPVMEKVAREFAGRFVLARVDVDASPGIAQAFQLQSVPAAVALLKGQPIPLFQGLASEDELRSFVNELLKVAQANGVTGQTGAEGEPAELPLPPLHQEAFDAIEAGDYAAAAAAYRKALAEQPGDNEARAGLAQVELMQRLESADANAIRAAAAESQDDLEAQLAVADLDVAGGHVEDAFARLVRFVGRSTGDERETARARLVELFDIVGASDPRVAKARQALARALF
ncbi:tetratricopeptide repeat protein [Arthrobacter sp. I2-34]|uniref:Tetratricopeptide repeat protein n=1 Tax=Arthrobacter hankyongi TaxID=2904801 RepID=A0ABS9LBE0_9MICC|nr:tetratricopeptide repeat protein [Arthrobacter hankyongi]MCG2624009.1 tetratricopeptide repeat protein [Arthrobacter hankyongi]